MAHHVISRCASPASLWGEAAIGPMGQTRRREVPRKPMVGTWLQMNSAGIHW